MVLIVLNVSFCMFWFEEVVCIFIVFSVVISFVVVVIMFFMLRINV